MDESKRKKLEENGWQVGSASEFLGLSAKQEAQREHEPISQLLADSVAAIKRSLAQSEAGQTRSADDAFDELEKRYHS
jgi:hypothetical protein